MHRPQACVCTRVMIALFCLFSGNLSVQSRQSYQYCTCISYTCLHTEHTCKATQALHRYGNTLAPVNACCAPDD
ncbi:hypothetical protein B0T17DRAFT_526024 [Bombardia bombarda]|uniref:Secreted protein n=1 Tax=Bombardia bombarda TaxID=252184 RepID=A0AA40C8N9_9PEZI|nr:hypothetical protein B0T17DRAFT_526024 [Bombardia bombarda]